MHDHHDHVHETDGDRRRLGAALTLVVAYMGAEALGGWWSGSLSLLADAGHMLSDAASLGLSLLAAWIVTRAPSPQQTFGYFRAEILAAIVNGVLLVAVAVGIAWEAWERLQEPHEINSTLMAVIAMGGLLVNLLMLKLLHATDRDNLNLRGAWLHAIGDALGSVAVLIAAALTYLDWTWADPAVSVLIGLLIVWSSGRLLWDAVAVLMEQSPASIEVEAVRAALRESPGVAGVHCLHVWSISSRFNSISAHVVLRPGTDAGKELHTLSDQLRHRFGVDHITLQLEPDGFTGCSEESGASCPLPLGLGQPAGTH